jgi:transposase
VRERHRFSRERFRRYLGEQPPATVLMEACGSAHYWGRLAHAHGHQVVLLPPHAVRPYVLRNKTDRTDAKGLLEAVRNDEVRPVPVKSETQQAVAALHRLRSTGLATRTARINTVRGLLREFGVVIPTGARHVVPSLGAVLEDADSGVLPLLRPALGPGDRSLVVAPRPLELQGPGPQPVRGRRRLGLGVTQHRARTVDHEMTW